MPRSTLDRRRFCAALAASLAAACTSPPPTSADPKVDLAGMLGLQPAERVWLDSLSAGEQLALREELRAGRGAPSRRTVDLIMKVIGRRERLFAYVGYPPRANGLTACDGLIRE